MKTSLSPRVYPSRREYPSRRDDLSRRDFLRSLSLLGAASLLAACVPRATSLSSQESESLRYLKILSTNDEHGWLEQGSEYGGADSLMYQWVHEERILDDPDHHLLLSAGDLYTGPALSTWFKGESTVDIMNIMGYHAAAIGNHDFDYGLENLQERAAQAKFPLISANIHLKATGAVPQFAHPFIIKEVNGLKIGLLGLTTRETPVDTKPAYVADLDFFHYETAMKEIVPQVRQAGADLVLILGHLCTADLRSLAPLARQLEIPILFGGHCHEVTNETVEGVLLVQSGSFMRGYTRIDLLFDLQSKKLVSLRAGFHRNEPGRVDKTVTDRIKTWRDQSDPALWQGIGYARQQIAHTSIEMAHLLAKAWLSAVQGAQVTLASARYVQSLPAGEITPADVVGMLATDDVLVKIELSGSQLAGIIEDHHPLLGGLLEKDGFRFPDGKPLDLERIYSVLVPDDIYAGCQGYPLKQLALSAQMTGIGWREPVIAWITAQKSSRSQPLESFLGDS